MNLAFQKGLASHKYVSILRRLLVSSAETVKSKVDKYGYDVVDGNKKRVDVFGEFHVGITKLPIELKSSLEKFYKLHPSRRIREDGLSLYRHLLNRGRPTILSWSKYKSKVKTKKMARLSDKEFCESEATASGLIHPENSQPDQDNSDAKPSESKSQAKKIQLPKRPKLAQYSIIRYGPRETQAYIASQVPSVYGATYRVFNEIKKRLPDYQPKTLLDFGSGSGMSVWAANEVWNGCINEYQCVDASQHMNSAAEFLLKGSSDSNDPLKIPNVFFKQFLPLSNKIMYDVVVATYSLTEMPFRKQRLQAIKSLWMKTNDFLILVEPGNNDGFDAVLQARQYITEGKTTQSSTDEMRHKDSSSMMFDEYNVDDDGDPAQPGEVFAPCAHEMTCARAFVETRDHPCNFSQFVELSFAQRFTKLKSLSYHNERFSFIILRKKDSFGSDREMPLNQGSWTRILKPMKKRKKHVICELCCGNGNIEQHVISKQKDMFMYKAARHRLKQGDMLPMTDSKKPMHIRKPIEPIIVGERNDRKPVEPEIVGETNDRKPIEPKIVGETNDTDKLLYDGENTDN